MTKFYGKIGYVDRLQETAPGVWEEIEVSRNYYGDIKRNTRRLQSSDQVNDDIVVNNEISIIADPYAVEHFHEMRYAEFAGTKWKITSIEVQYPRLILTLGGVYNGEEQTRTS